MEWVVCYQVIISVYLSVCLYILLSISEYSNELRGMLTGIVGFFHQFKKCFSMLPRHFLWYPESLLVGVCVCVFGTLICTKYIYLFRVSQFLQSS